jgi:hypothetical protein
MFVNNIEKINLNNSLLILDEIHNIISYTGSFYEIIYNKIKKSKNCLIVALSGTPIYDKPNELGLLMNILNESNDFPVGNQFDNKFIKKNKLINKDELMSRLDGYISYYEPPNIVFPEKKIKILKCLMSDFQYTEYKKTLPLINKNDINNKENYNSDDIINLPNNFYINSRMMLNMVFPNKKKGFDGYKSITIKTIENLKKYSTKYFELFKKLKKKGTCFIYSNFKEYGGIYTIQLILDFYGYNNFKNNGVGKNTYAIWSGDESNEYKNIVKETFNNFNNFKGENIKIIIGSPSIKEGVSLYGVRNVHIIDPYWNWSRLD